MTRSGGRFGVQRLAFGVQRARAKRARRNRTQADGSLESVFLTLIKAGRTRLYIVCPSRDAF
jgi:hypothetical protein